jgi:hypothetical protein
VKLRIQDNSLRFRLTQTEVVQLRENGRVDAEVRFNPDRALRYSVCSSRAVESVGVEYSADCIRVMLPRALVCVWAGGDEVSIESDSSVRVLVEKDFQCLHGPERWDPDAWPNPLAEAQGK